MLGLTLLFASLMVAMNPVGRVRLGADVLSSSRGGNTNNMLMQYSCDVLSNNTACSTLGAGHACVTCSTSNYTSLTNGSSGGLNNGYGHILGGCGTRYGGICAANLICVTGNTGYGPCANAPGLPTSQP